MHSHCKRYLCAAALSSDDLVQVRTSGVVRVCRPIVVARSLETFHKVLVQFLTSPLLSGGSRRSSTIRLLRRGACGGSLRYVQRAQGGHSRGGEGLPVFAKKTPTWKIRLKVYVPPPPISMLKVVLLGCAWPCEISARFCLTHGVHPHQH